MSNGWAASAAYDFNKWLGVAAEYSGHYNDQAHVTTGLIGPQLHFRTPIVSPFVEILAGVARLSAPNIHTQAGFSAGGGGGIDLYVTRRIAIRAIQADYLYQTYRVRNVGSDGRFDGARLQAGLVVGLGSWSQPTTPAAICSVQPAAAFAGETMTATVTPQNFNPKHTLTYEWKVSGGKIAGKDATAAIDTTGVNPASYVATAAVTDPKAPKNYRTATCNASFTINEMPKQPPTLTCSAAPATVRSGNFSTITCQGNSTDNRPLTYACQTQAGRLSGTGPTFALDTAGAPAGVITVNCTTTDNRGLSGSSAATVNVEVPPPAANASNIGESKIAEIAFPNKLKPSRIDNTAKAILDDVALRLQHERDGSAVIVGYSGPSEKGGIALAQQRAVNANAYLVEEKGIDPNRIEIRTGTGDLNQAKIYVVPAGATFNLSGTQVFKESEIKPAAATPARRHRGVRKAPAPKS